ncbi:hypothetical protein AN963_18360 [Brevibacillus choshinensis]|uniref:D-glucuronyl C5-epimerase C-terminal domain-containing protein n=1 Tax=Brevibacillus choshinensis TaxID=54911 RepID=A0ABR5N8D5_BRECH|nr:D-glucuronyl C5-epimerase family protein [Brevibacillus choshinensis]KQL46857.1 hypothetical protein AN963_18360 [Brevibacillus choshinensis]
MTFQMPDFSHAFAQRSRDLYHIRFLDDGYPGKVIENEIVPHPLFGTFVIRDYVTQFEETGAPQLKEAIMRVADAAISRMEKFHDAIVFWYPLESSYNYSNQLYYSGLTQSHYMQLFSKVYELTGETRYKIAAEKMFASLKIPVDSGGVYHLSSYGPTVQETPMSPISHILNGWLSAITNIKRFADTFKHKEAHQFWEENMSTLMKMLPLFDIPKLANTRYLLNGPVAFKLVTTIQNVEIHKVKLKVPDEGIYDITLPEIKKSWSNFIEPRSVRVEGPKILFNNKKAKITALVSRYPYPSENKLILTLASPENTTLSVEMQHGEFLPTKNRQQNCQFTQIAHVPLAKGFNQLEISIPRDLSELVGYPTIFKQIGTRYYNNYHFIHIVKMEDFYQDTGENIFKHYAEKWNEYVKMWPTMELYNGMEARTYEFIRLR